MAAEGTASQREADRTSVVKSVVSYETVHARLRRLRGRARDQKCIQCGEQAQQWAYQGGDPDERRHPRHDYPYSLELDRYAPMCMSCHRLLDNPIRRGHPPEVCINGHPWAKNTGIRLSNQRKGRYCIACNIESRDRCLARKRAGRAA